jgi:hypothetical protein
MTRRGASLLLDAAMLLSFTVLMSWRLTGVPAHEWLAAGLLGLIVVHLVAHWGWVETRARRAVGTGSLRTRMNLLLNGLLFLAMGTALTSGFCMSKVVVPNTLTPGAYLTWHQVHDLSSSLALFILGLHVALNWDLIVAGVRCVARGEATVSSFVPVGRGTAPARAIRGLAWVTATSALLAVVTWKAGGALPPQTKVMIQTRDGHVEESEPPAVLTRVLPGSERPAPARAGAPFVMRLLLLSAVVVAGRKALKLRLD